MEILAQVLIIICTIVVALILLSLVIATIYWQIFKLCHTTKLTKKQEKQLIEAYEKFKKQQQAGQILV